jgi:O-antigen ligase
MRSADLASAAGPIRPDESAPSQPAATSRIVVFAGVALLLVVTLANPSATRMHTWPWALAVALLWMLPLVLVCAHVGASTLWCAPSPAISAGIAVLGVCSVLSAWWSPFSAASLARTWATLGGCAFFLLLHDGLRTTGTSRAAKRIGQVVSLAGAAIVVASLVGWWREATGSIWLVRNTAPFGHSNYTAGVLVLLLPWCACAAWSARGLARVVWTAVAAGGLLALAGTSSRGGVLALAATAGGGVAVALAIAPWPRTRKLFVAAVTFGLVLAAVFANQRLRDLVLHRTWTDAARESNTQRSAMLAAGWKLGRERPLLGWGPGTVPLAYPAVRATLDGGVENVLQLHDTPVQLWATLGVPGLVALLLLTGGTLAAAAKLLRQRQLSPPVCAATASLAGYGIFAFTDHQFDLPIVAALAAVDLAILTSAVTSRAPRRLSPRIRFAGVAACCALALGPAYALTRDLLARHAYDQGLTALGKGDGEKFLAEMDRATRLNPEDPFFQHQAAGFLLREREASSGTERQNALARAAADRLRSSLATGAHEEYAHFNLGWLHLALDEPSAAARHFIADAQLVPDKGGVYFGLGLALRSAGHTPEAIRAFALEWVNDPRSMLSPAWEVSSLAPLRPAVQAELWRLYARLRAEYPPAARAEAWARWWAGENVSPDQLGRGFTSEAAAFAAALPLRTDTVSPAGTFPWQKLLAAWRARDFTTLVRNDAPFAAALARRTGRHPDDFRAFLTAGTEDEPAQLRTLRRSRTGYGVLTLHPEGPVLNDLYLVQETRVIADFAAGLFPPKGWLPGRFLLALLPPEPR